MVPKTTIGMCKFDPLMWSFKNKTCTCNCTETTGQCLVLLSRDVSSMLQICVETTSVLPASVEDSSRTMRGSLESISIFFGASLCRVNVVTKEKIWVRVDWERERAQFRTSFRFRRLAVLLPFFTQKICFHLNTVFFHRCFCVVIFPLWKKLGNGILCSWSMFFFYAKGGILLHCFLRCITYERRERHSSS